MYTRLKRRLIVAAILRIENGYTATLGRLVADYKRPLEAAALSIISRTKIQTLFHRLAEILHYITFFVLRLTHGHIVMNDSALCFVLHLHVLSNDLIDVYSYYKEWLLL